MANEKRLIDAYTLAEEIESLTVTVAGKPAKWNDAKHSVLRILAEQPDVDAVEVVHGRWERYWSEEYFTYFHSCSACFAPALTKEETMHDEVLSNYCPNCGADMRERRDDG